MRKTILISSFVMALVILGGCDGTQLSNKDLAKELDPETVSKIIESLDPEMVTEIVQEVDAIYDETNKADCSELGSDWTTYDQPNEFGLSFCYLNDWG